jgi:ferredoxin-NADP reductase
VRDRDVYLCGPERLAAALAAALAQTGVAPAHIHFESFAS